MKVCIIGAGLAGLSTAYHLEQLGIHNYELYERDSRIGGLCKSDKVGGFTFDRTLHVIYVADEYVRHLLTKLLGDNLLMHRRRAYVRFRDVIIPYPFQMFFSVLPYPDIVNDCVSGLVSANREIAEPDTKSDGFEEWIYRTFGSGIAKYFMIPYNKKMWACQLNQMSLEWVKKYIPKPNVAEIQNFMEGKKSSREYGYNATFYYPRNGGIENLPRAILNGLERSRVLLNREVESISLQNRTIKLSDGHENHWDTLVSTMPLPDLFSHIIDTPRMIEAEVDKLKWVSIYNLNLGVYGEAPDLHWIYFPGRYIFHRVGLPSNLSSSMAPDGMYSLSAEVSYSPTKQLPKNVESRIVRDLVKARLLKDPTDINVKATFDLPCAYVVCDHQYFKTKEIIHSFLSRKRIFSVGRYGAWEYTSMQDSIIDGKEIAEKMACASKRVANENRGYGE